MTKRTEVTEQDAERIADQLEHGNVETRPLPIDEWPDSIRPARGRGRPSLTGQAGTRSPQVTFRVDPVTRAAAQRRAEDEGTTVSQLARRALEQYLAS